MDLRVDSSAVVKSAREAQRTAPWQSLGTLGTVMVAIYALFAIVYPITSYYGIFIPGAQRVKPVYSLMERNLILLDRSVYVAVILLLHAAYLGAVALVMRRAWSSGWRAANSGTSGRTILIIGVVCATILVWTYPLFSQDVFDYIFHTREWIFLGGNPFTQTPDTFSYDHLFRYVAWTDAPSQYGPLWIMFTAPFSLLAGSNLLANLLFFKGVALLSYAGTAWLIYLILGRIQPRYQLPGTLLFAWNPLILLEFGLNGHNDIVMLFFVVLAVWLLINERHALSITALVAGSLIKIVPVFILPLFAIYIWKRLRKEVPRPVPTACGRLERAHSFLRHLSAPATSRRDFVTQTLALTLPLLIVAYVPFWDGLNTFSILHRGDLVGGTPIYANLQMLWEAVGLDRGVGIAIFKVISWGSFAVFYPYLLRAFWRGNTRSITDLRPVKWALARINDNIQDYPALQRAQEDWRATSAQAERDIDPRITSLFRACLAALVFFTLVGSVYYQPWYLAWSLVWLPLLLHPRHRLHVWPLVAFSVVTVLGYVFV